MNYYIVDGVRRVCEMPIVRLLSEACNASLRHRLVIQRVDRKLGWRRTHREAFI